MKFRLKAASGPLTGRTFDIGERLVIGSADDVDVRDPGLAPHHAVLRLQDGGLVLESDHSVEVNGEPVTVHGLESGDEIRVATLRFVLQAPGLKPVRVLDAPRPSGRTRAGWWIGAVVLAASAVAAWWWLAGPGSGAGG